MFNSYSFVVEVVEFAEIRSRTSSVRDVRMLLWEQVVVSVNQLHLKVLGERTGLSVFSRLKTVIHIASHWTERSELPPVCSLHCLCMIT